jgi:bifunctional N-acetylglucosamine-1-phosphate-uridyltransferase/glucosamine-1-phosphate-acetyltransferase GlmU-like protein
MTATEILDELASLALRNIGASTCLGKFLNESPIVATLEIDERATIAAGEIIYRDEPTEALFACLAACRAADSG